MDGSEFFKLESKYAMFPMWYFGVLLRVNRSRVELEAIVIKGYSAFPKAPALLKPHHQNCLTFKL